MNGEDIKRLHPVRPIVPFPSGFENMSSEEQRAFLQRESLSLQRNENSYSQLKGELEDDLKTVGIEIDLPMEFENFDQTRKIDTLTDAKNFIGKIKKDGKLDVLVNILKSRFNGKFVVQRSQNSYRYLQSLVNESDGSEGVATGGLIAMTSDIDEHTPAGRRLQGALAMEGNDQAMEMENKNLIKTLENNGFTFSIDMESRGIRMDPERQNHIIIGELADRSAVNVFLKSALSEGVVKEDMGEILGSKKIQRENILDQKPIAPEVESMEELLGSTQLDEVEKVTNNTEQTTQNPEKERILQELSNIRSELAEMDALTHSYSGKTGKSFFALKDEYNAKKEELLKHIENEIRKEKEYGPLTQEQEREVKSKFGDELYKVLKSENDLYKTALKETRGETWKGKAKESFRDLLGTKGMKWYMGLSRIQRFALNTALFSVIGAGVAFAAPTGTAATAIGVGTYRVARGVGAFAGSGLGMWGSNKILKPEQLNEWKTQEEQKIKDSEDSIEVKSERIKELEEEFNRRLRNLNIKKIGLTALAGGIGGAVSGGILDYAYGGSGGSTGSAVENLRKGANASERLGGRGPRVAPIEDTKVPEPTKPNVPEDVVKEATNLDKVVGQPGTEVAAKLFSYPGAVIQTPLQGKGDSVWRLTKYVLENNERFSNLAHSGQKDNVISWYTNKIINDPSLINSVKDPNFGVKLEVDKPVDFSKVFGDEAEFEKVLSRAEKLSPELIKQIEEKTQALESVYKFNPTKTLTNEEILKVEDMPKASVGVEIEDIKKPEISDIGKSDVPEPIGKLGRYLTESEKAEFMGPALDRIEKIEGNLSELKKLGIEEGRLKGIEEQALEFKKRIKYLGDNYTGPDGKVDAVKDVLGTSENIEKLEKEIENLVKEEIERHRGLAPLPKVPDLGAGYAMGAGAVIGGGLLNKMAGANGTDFVKREEVEDEIRRAKERLEEIEREKNQKVVQMPVRNGALIRSPGMDMDRASRTPDAIDVKVEEAFINTINSVYGEAGILGLGKKKNGVLSKGWALMKGLSAKEVIKFFTNDSDQTKLPSNVLDSLKKDKNHGNFGIELLKLIEIAGSMRRPENSVLNANSNKLDLNLEPRSETENVESYIKRIARFVTEMESERNRTQSSIKMAA